MTAFNLNPGGCCCTDFAVLDIYRGTQFGVVAPPSDFPPFGRCSSWPGGGVFRRVTSLTETTKQWSIAPTQEIIDTRRIITAAGDREIAWAIFDGIESGPVMSRFNSETQLEELYVPAFNSFRSGTFWEGCNDAQFGIIQLVNLQFDSHRLEVISDSGIQNRFFRIIDDPVHAIASRYWPRGAGARLDGGSTEFYVFNGVEVVGNPPNGRLRVLNKEVVLQTPASQLGRSFAVFDATQDGWAGVVAYSIDGTAHHVFFINGVQVEHLVIPPNSEQPTILEVHVAHPHESIGPVVVVSRRVAPFQPSLQRLEIYTLNGVKIWDSDPIPTISCRHSSDRWLYVTTSPLAVEDMPGEILEPPTSGADAWLLRHNGSESVPLNTLVSGQLRDGDVVRNSKKLEDVPPLENFSGRACVAP